MTAGSPIPVRHVETGAVYPSVRNAVRVVLGREAHGRHFFHYGAGMPVAPGLTLVPLSDAERMRGGVPRRVSGRGGPKPRPVRCINTSVVYESARAAGRAVFADRSAIYRAIRCDRPCCDLTWEYADA